MHINKNSWHYKLYRYTYSFFNDFAPKHTNLCSYTQRIFWVTLIIGLIYFFLGLCVAVYYGLISPVMFIFGKRPINIFAEDALNNGPIFVPYTGLFGFLKPWHVLLIGMIATTENWGWSNHQTGMIWGHAVLMVIIILAVTGLWLFSSSESSRLARAYLSSKKSRVCPLVEFTEEPTSSDINE